MSAIFEFDQRGIRRPERHPPDRIGDAGGMAGEIGGERVVAGVDGHDVGTERDAGGAGEGGEIDDEVGRLLAGEGERIGEDEAAFGIGVADLDGQALAALEDVAGAEGGAGDGILDRRNEDAQAQRQLRRP